MPESYFLQTDTLAQTVDALRNAGLIDADGNPINCDIDYIGALYFADGSVDPRFHTNVLCPTRLAPDYEVLLPLVHPANPIRIWA